MQYIKPTTMLIPTAFLLLFNACNSTKVTESNEGYYHSGIYFGKHLTVNYKKGIKDGCTTSKGEYKKSHILFKSDYAYNKGWFLGRNKCRHLLVIDEN